MNQIRCAGFCAVLYLLTGCGGSGESGDVGDAPQSASAGLNGSVTGRVYFSGYEEDYLDLSTGLIVDLPQGEGFTPRADGLELTSRKSITKDTECQSFPHDHHRIGIHDALTGDQVAYFDVRGRVNSATLSPDGAFVKLTWADDPGSYCEAMTAERFFTENWLFTREGEPVRKLEAPGSTHWLSSTKLLSVQNGFLVTLDISRPGEVEPLVDLSSVGAYEGIGPFSVHPVTGEIVFEIVRRFSSGSVTFREADIWMANGDGSNLRQVLSPSRSDELSVPMWSADGETLLVLQDASGGAVFFVDEFNDFSVEVISPEVDTKGMYAIPYAQISDPFPPASFAADGVRPILRSWDDADAIRLYDPNVGYGYKYAPSPE